MNADPAKTKFKLKPCPFCGNKGVKKCTYDNMDQWLCAGHTSSSFFAVECYACHCKGPTFTYPEYDEDGIGVDALDEQLTQKAIDAWNKRDG